ncbi:MAG: class I SAM-dependent methyltransferase [Oscillospiraceae bacterium]
MLTLEESKQAWLKQGQHGSVDERLQRYAAWDAYYAYLAEKRRDAPPEPSMAAREVTAYLEREGVLTPQSSVLDIGAGMGDYSLTMAARCAEVDALDRSSACLDILEQRATHFRLRNLHTICRSWEQFTPDRQYDVSFSSMCPAICSFEELRKMESMTAKTCCLIAVMRGSYDKHRRAMMQQFHIQPKGGMTTEALQYFETLYLMGRQPNVKCWHAKYSYRIPVEQAMEQYLVYFSIFGLDENTSREYLQSYFAEHAADGYLEEESQMNTALIFWSPKE